VQVLRTFCLVVLTFTSTKQKKPIGFFKILKTLAPQRIRALAYHPRSEPVGGVTHPVYAPHSEAKQCLLDVKYEQVSYAVCIYARVASPRALSEGSILRMSLDRRLPSPSSTNKVPAGYLSERSCTSGGVLREDARCFACLSEGRRQR